MTWFGTPSSPATTKNPGPAAALPYSRPSTVPKVSILSWALVSIDAVLLGAGGSLATVESYASVVDNDALPTCVAHALQEALTDPPEYFCYTPNGADACLGDPDLCHPLENP